MTTPAASYQPRPRRMLYYAIPIAALGLLAAYAIGRWTSEPPASSMPREQAVPAYAEPPASAPAIPRPTVAKAPPPPPAPAAAPPTAAGPTPEVMARATEQAKAQIEVLRPQYISRCWPSGGLKGGRNNVKLTFNIAFDANGREIMRGISEDRRAPAGAFAKCLREMEGVMSVQPTGTSLAVSVPVTFP